jgi:hypothetical protein
MEFKNFKYIKFKPLIFFYANYGNNYFSLRVFLNFTGIEKYDRFFRKKINESLYFYATANKTGRKVLTEVCKKNLSRKSNLYRIGHNIP